jgi:hypothetical protein
MKQNTWFNGRLGTVLTTAGLIGLSSLHTCIADVARPAHAAHANPTAETSHKSGSGIQIQSTVNRLGGDSVEVLLRIEGVNAADGATISYTLSGAGQITAQEKDLLPAGQVATRRVTVRLAPGEEPYLNVFTRQADRSSVISIALDKSLARKKAAPAGPVTQDSTGRDLIVMPGQLRK